MRPLSAIISLLLLVLLSAPRDVARAPRPAVPDAASLDGEQDLSLFTLEESTNVDVGVTYVSPESETPSKSAAAMDDDSAAEVAGPARSNRGKEYRLKASFLWNFARYTTWPAGTFAEPNSPIVFGILGEDPFGAEIDKTLKDKKVGRRPIVIRRFSLMEDVSGVHLLFVGRPSRKEREQLRRRFAGEAVLTVGDDKGIAGKGVVAAFYLERKKVRFEMSVQAIRSSKLTISSQLLKLARIIDRKQKSPVEPGVDQGH